MAGYDVSITITTRWREAGKPPSPEPVQKTEQAVRRTTAALKEQQSILARFIRNWKNTFAVFAAGYVSVVAFLEVLRLMSQTIAGGIQKIAEFESAVASLTARLMSLIGVRPGESLSAGWDRLTEYVKNVYNWAIKLDAQFSGTTEELMEAFRALADQGIILNVQAEEHRKAWLAIAEAAKAVNPHIRRQGQMYQEIRAWVQGIVRQGNELARQSEAMIPNYKEQVKLLASADEWVQFINTHFLGYLVLSKKIGDTWDAVVSTFESYFTLLQRMGLRPLFETLKNIIASMADYLRKHLVPLSLNFAAIWKAIGPAIQLIADIFGIIFKTVSALSPIIAAFTHAVGTLASLFRVPLKLFSMLLDNAIEYETHLYKIEEQQKKTFAISEEERRLLELRKKEEQIDLTKPLQLAEEAEYELLAAAKSATYARIELKRREVKDAIEAIQKKIKALLLVEELESKVAKQGMKEAEERRRKWESDYKEWVRLNSELSQLQQRLYRMPLGGGAEAGEIMSRIRQIQSRILGLSESLNKYNKAQEDYVEHAEKAKEADEKIATLRKKLVTLNKYLALLNEKLAEEEKKIAEEKEKNAQKELLNIKKLSDAYAALAADYERYQTQMATVTEDLATERLRIESELTGSLEAQYRYRVQQVERWEAEKWNRVKSIQESMLKKIDNMRRQIEEQRAKENRELRLDEAATLVDLEIKEMEIYKDVQEKKVEIARIAAEKEKQIFLDTYGYAINLGEMLESTVADAFEGIVLGTRKLEDVFTAMRDVIVERFSRMFARMIRDKLDFDTFWVVNVENMPKQFEKSVFNIRSIWNSLMNWMTSSIGKLTGAIGTIGYGIAGMVGGEPWRAIGGTAATAAMLTGHPVIAVATITTAEIARAIFKGRVEWVSVGAPAAGMAGTRIGLERGWWESMSTFWKISLSFLTGWIPIFGSIFGRKWPTIRGTLEASLTFLTEASQIADEYAEEISKVSGGTKGRVRFEEATENVRVIILQWRDVKGSMDELSLAFLKFTQDVIDTYNAYFAMLPEDIREALIESLPQIEFAFAGGRKDMEILGKKVATKMLIETYLSWGVPLIEEFNKLLGIDLFEKFGLEKTWEELIEKAGVDIFREFGRASHKRKEEIEELYEYVTQELQTTVDVVLRTAGTLYNLMKVYGDGVEIYFDSILNYVKDIVDKYTAEMSGLKEEEVAKKAEELGKTVDEYLSAVVSFIEDIEDTIAEYTLAPAAREIRDIEKWYQERIAEAESLGLSIERLNQAMALKFFKPIEDIIDTRSDFEKAIDELNEWYLAATDFFERHQEVLESLGYSIEEIILAYRTQLERLFLSPLEELRKRIASIGGGVQITPEERAAEISRILDEIMTLLASDTETLASQWEHLLELLNEYINLQEQAYEEQIEQLRDEYEKRKELTRKAYEEEMEKIREEYQARIDAIQDEISQVEELMSAWESIQDRVDDLIEQIEEAGKTPVESLESAWSEFQDLLREIMEAPPEERPELIEELLDLMPEILNLAEDIFGQGEILNQLQQYFLDILEHIGAEAESQLDVLKETRDALEAQKELLEDELDMRLSELNESMEAALNALDEDLQSKIDELTQSTIDALMSLIDTVEEAGEGIIDSMTGGEFAGISEEKLEELRESLESLQSSFEGLDLGTINENISTLTETTTDLIPTMSENLANEVALMNDQILPLLQHIDEGINTVLVNVINSAVSTLSEAVGTGVASINGQIASTGASLGNAISSAASSISSAISSAASSISASISAIQCVCESHCHCDCSCTCNVNTESAQAGGIVTRPTLLMVGEAGPEAIIPLSRLSQYVPTSRYTYPAYYEPFIDPWKLWDEIRDLVDAIRELTEELADWIEEALNPLYDFEKDLDEIIEETKEWIKLLEAHRDYLESIGYNVDQLIDLVKQTAWEKILDLIEDDIEEVRNLVNYTSDWEQEIADILDWYEELTRKTEDILDILEETLIPTVLKKYGITTIQDLEEVIKDLEKIEPYWEKLRDLIPQVLGDPLNEFLKRLYWERYKWDIAANTIEDFFNEFLESLAPHPADVERLQEEYGAYLNAWLSYLEKVREGLWDWATFLRMIHGDIIEIESLEWFKWMGTWEPYESNIEIEDVRRWLLTVLSRHLRDFTDEFIGTLDEIIGRLIYPYLPERIKQVVSKMSPEEIWKYLIENLDKTIEYLRNLLTDLGDTLKERLEYLDKIRQAAARKISNVLYEVFVEPMEDLREKIERFSLGEEYVAKALEDAEAQWNRIADTWQRITETGNEEALRAMASNWERILEDAENYIDLLEQAYEREVDALEKEYEARMEGFNKETGEIYSTWQDIADLLTERGYDVGEQWGEAWEKAQAVGEGVSEAFDIWRDWQEEQLDALEDLKSDWEDVMESAQELIDELTTVSELAPVQSWEAIQRRWEELRERMISGDVEAARALIDFTETYLEMARTLTPSQYVNIYQDVLGTLQQSRDIAEDQISTLGDLADSIRETVEAAEVALEDIMERLNDELEQRIEDLRQEYAARMDEVYSLLEDMRVKIVTEVVPPEFRDDVLRELGYQIDYLSRVEEILNNASTADNQIKVWKLEDVSDYLNKIASWNLDELMKDIKEWDLGNKVKTLFSVLRRQSETIRVWVPRIASLIQHTELIHALDIQRNEYLKQLCDLLQENKGAGEVPSLQTGGIIGQEGIYRLHPGEIVIPRNANIRVEIDADKLGESIASSLIRAGIASKETSSIHLHIDGREIAAVTAEQIRRGHPELVKQVRRITH